MKCISDEMIQKFTDGETNPKEEAVIRSHLTHCNSCAIKVNHRKRLSAGVKKAVNLLAKEKARHPAPAFDRKIPLGKPRITRKVYYGIAAACAIIVLLILVPFQNNGFEQDAAATESLQRDYNANKTFMQQEMVIQIIDPRGTVNEFVIE